MDEVTRLKCLSVLTECAKHSVRLEKLGVLSSVEDWQYFRALRNSLAHEYPERAEDVTNAINALYSAWPCFQDLYLRLKETAEHTL